MKIYVASLAAYNSGAHHGIWIEDFYLEVEELEESIQKMLDRCPYQGKEWQIHDQEGFGDIDLNTGSLEEILQLVELLEAHGEKLVNEVCANFYHVSEVLQAFEQYDGGFKYKEDWVDRYFLNHKTKDPDLRRYFDYEKYLRDREIDTIDIYKVDNIYYIFRQH